MRFPITPAQMMKSVAGAALFLLDPVSCRLTGLFPHLLDKLVSLVFWVFWRALGLPENRSWATICTSFCAPWR